MNHNILLHIVTTKEHFRKNRQSNPDVKVLVGFLRHRIMNLTTIWIRSNTDWLSRIWLVYISRKRNVRDVLSLICHHRNRLERSSTCRVEYIKALHRQHFSSVWGIVRQITEWYKWLTKRPRLSFKTVILSYSVVLRAFVIKSLLFDRILISQIRRILTCKIVFTWANFITFW